MRLLRARSRVSPEILLELAGRTGRAGRSLCGDVVGAVDPTVTLLRLERSPAGTYTFAVCAGSTEPGDDRTRFELALPTDAPPGWDDGRCSLAYVVRAVSVQRRRRGHAAVPVGIAGGDRRIHEAAGYLDRMIPSQPARHFHLELADAELEGGGFVHGRVHTDPRLEGSSLEVALRCEEAWCTNLRFRNPRHALMWRTRMLWEQTGTIELDAGRRWYPFEFEIPEGLPPAVEGRAIAWRYQVEARRRARLAVTERATLTPVRFEV